MLSKDFELFYYNDKHITPLKEHSHKYYEFYFFLGGDVSITIKKQKFTLEKGDMILLPPGVKHYITIHDPDVAYQRFVFWITPEFASELQKLSEDYIYLLESLAKYEIKVFGKTKEERLAQREEGILKYLELHPEVEEFVILDDQHYGFKVYSKLWDSFIDTHGMGIEHSSAASETPSVPAILFFDAVKKYAKD